GVAADGSCCNADCSAFTCLTPTPTPTTTHTRTPTPTRTATPIPTQTATLTPGGPPTQTATGGTTPGTPIAIPLTPTVTATAAVTATVTLTPTITPTAVPTITASATATPVVSATTTPVTSATLVPTPVPTSIVVELGGLSDAVAAKNAVKCQQAIDKGGVSFLSSRLKQLDACTVGILKCVQTKPDDATCVPKASAKCAALRGAATAARAKFLATVAAKCGSTIVSTNDLRGVTGIGYAGLDSDCEAELGHAPANVADVAECIARRY